MAALTTSARIAQAKADALAARRALDAYDGEFAGARPLIGRVLGTAVQLGLVTWRLLLASLPVLALLVWLSTAYGYAFPATRRSRSARCPRLARHGRRRSRSRGHQVLVLDGAGNVVERVALSAPVPTIHKRQWWNALVGNPIGYLPDTSRLDRSSWPCRRRNT